LYPHGAIIIREICGLWYDFAAIPKLITHPGGLMSRVLKEIVFVVVALMSISILSSQSPKTASSVHVFPGRNGIALIAMGQDGFALAADGAQYNADGTISQTQKILQVGKMGALVFAGKSSQQDPVTLAVREEFNPLRIATPWLEKHPDVSIDTASRELGAILSEAANKYFSKRVTPKDAGKPAFSAIFVGFANGQPFINGNRYYLPAAPGKELHAEPINAAPTPGEIWMLGLTKVAQELMTKNSAALTKFKADPAVAKLRGAKPAELSAQGYASAFNTVLNGVESAEGRKFDTGPALVGGPNRIATITSKEGFALQ
jgi:hypothetical protein